MTTSTRLERDILLSLPELLKGDLLMSLVGKSLFTMGRSGCIAAFDDGGSVGRFNYFEFESALVTVEHDPVAFPWLFVSRVRARLGQRVGGRRLEAVKEVKKVKVLGVLAVV